MKPNLLTFLSEPITKLPLALINQTYDSNRSIESGELVSELGSRCLITRVIPRLSDNISAKSDSEIKDLIFQLQSNPVKILNLEKYFLRPAPIGCALRIFRK